MGAEGREKKRRGRRKGGKRRCSSHTFCFSNLGSFAHQWPVTTTRPYIAFSSHSPDGALVTDNKNAQTKVCLYFAMCYFYGIKCHHSFPKYSVLRREFGAGGTCPKNSRKNIFRAKIMYSSGILLIFSGIYHVKFGNFVNFWANRPFMWNSGIFVNFHAYIFRQKCLPPKVDFELLRLWRL